MKNGNACETLEEFYAEVMAFRRWMVSRVVMEDSDRRQGLIMGLGICWLNVRLGPEDHVRADTAFKSAMDEFSVRSVLVDMHLEDLRRAS